VPTDKRPQKKQILHPTFRVPHNRNFIYHNPSADLGLTKNGNFFHHFSCVPPSETPVYSIFTIAFTKQLLAGTVHPEHN
jgi:hypothetical protein